MDIPEFKTQEEVVAWLTKQKFTVRTPEDEAKFVEVKTSEAISKHMGTVLGDLDKSVKEVAQVDKQEGEKTSEYVKRIIKEQIDALSTTQEDLKKHLDGEMSKDETLKTIKAQLDTAKADLKKTTEAREQEKLQWEQKSFQTKVDIAIQGALAKIRPTLKKFSKDGEEDLIMENNIKAIVSDFRESVQPQDVEGTLVFKDREGKPLQSTTDGSFLTVDALLQDRFQPFVDTGRTVTGAGGIGSKPGVTPPNGAGGEYKLSLPETVKSQVALTDYLASTLKEKNIGTNDVEFTKYFTANKEGLPLR